MIRKILMGLAAVVGFTTAATADTRFTYAPNYTWKTPTNVGTFHTGTYIPFDPTTEEDLPGSSPAWQIFASNQTQYTAPGAVMRYIEGYRQSSDAQFSPLTFGGMLVEEGATGYAVTGNSGNGRNTELGDKRATGGVPTWFVYNESFTFNRTTGTFTLFGDINFDVAGEKVVDLNSARSDATLDPATRTTLRMNGEGQIKVKTLVATGAVTLDYSALAMSQDPLYIDGNLTCDASTKFAFPADFEEGITLQLCTGTLSGLEDQSVHEITIGEKTAFARLSVNDNSISFAWVEDNKATVSGYTKWNEIQWEEEYIPGLPVELTLTADAEIDFDTEDITIPGLTLKGAYEAILRYTVTPTIGVIELEDGATVVHKFPLTEERTEALTVPAGQTYILVGGAESAITCSGKITVNGTLKTEGKLNFSNSGNVVPAGGELIAKGELTLKGADRGLSGTLTIEAGATLTAASGDFMNYNANQSPVLNIKGTLDFSTYRWTIGASSTPTVNMYTGGQVLGTGDKVGAFHIYAVNDWNVIKTDGEDIFTVSAPTPLQSSPTIDVQAGATLDFTGRVYCPYGGKTITLSGEGTTRFSGEYTGALTVEEDGQVKLTGAANPSSISGLGSVTLANGTGTVTNTSDTANFTGTITVDASVTTLFLGTSRPKCDFIFAGTTEVVYTENISDDGVVQQLNVTSGTAPTYKVMGVDGTEKVITEGTYTPTVTGKTAWYAWEFSGTLDSVGQDTAAMGQDHGPYYTDDNEAIYAYSQPHKNLTWPDESTTAIACTLPTNANVCLVGWGQATPGGIALTAGDVTKNEVKLVYWQNNTAYTVLTTMTVPNASTCEHLYLVTKTADGVKVYLDGTLAAEYKGALSLGKGIQVGTVFQGVGNTGLIRLDNVYSGTNDCKAVVDSLRIYKTVLGPNAIKALVDEFPYVSPNGTFTRALTGAENQWVVADAWTKVGPGTTHAAPDAESTVNLSAAAEATITLNLEEPTDYEALNLSGEGVITIAAPAANENKISSSGLVKIGADATIEYSAMDLAGTRINIAPGKTLTIDASMIDLTQYYATTTVPLTGLITGDGEIAFEVPEKITGRSAKAQFNESNNTWELKIEVIKAPFIYYGGAWTWSGGAVTPEIVSNNTAVAVIVGNGTLEWPMDRAEFEVQGGTLKATEAGTSTITVSGGAFDVNGLSGSLYTVILNGGSLVNNGKRIGDANQITAINLTDEDSTVGGLYDFSLQGNASGQYGDTSMNLDSYTLTKTGTNSFALVNTTIDGTGTLYVEEGEVYSSENTVFTNGTLKIGKNGTFRQRADGRTLKIAKIVGEGGTLNNEGTVSDFTLEGTLNIANAGTYGTITLDDATLNAGEKRGLALEGSGTVNAQLTLVEMAAAEPITLFTTTESEFVVVLTDYNGRDLEPGTDYTIEGGVVTPKAIPFIYSDGWTWNKDSVTPEVVAAATNAQIVVAGGTCEWNMDRLLYMVNGGTLKATGKKKANGAVTVNENGTFDVNGIKDTEWTVVLNGGKLVNNGGAIGNTSKQINLLSLLDFDSTVDAAANFGLIKAGYNPTTLDLGGKKLTKTGAATFWLCNATVTNGTFEVAEGTLQTVGEKDERVVVFADDASLILDEGTTLAVTRPLTIGAIESDGATIDNTKSITAFTLKGEVTLSGNGTWGTITLDSKLMNPAVLNVGTIRGLTLDGNGTVNAVLTAAEIAAKGPVEIFTTESKYVVGGTVLDEAGNEVPGQWLGGSYQVTHEAKIGTTYYLTFAEAIGALQDGDTLTLLKSIETDEKAAFVIDNDITLDFGDYTVEKTVANDYTFDITTNATVTFTGKTGGVKQTASELNPKTPAAAIRNKGNLTITGGVYTSDVCVIKNDEDPGAGELTVEGGTFEIVEAAEGMAQIQMALMNWATATISGGTWNGTIGTRSCDGNKVSEAGATEITSSLKGTVDYLLYVGYPGDTTYANVPAIKGVAKSNVTLGKVSSITDELELVEDGDWVTVQKKSPIEPVDPSAGGKIECEDEETATALAAAITANPGQYIKAPEGLDETAAAIYKGMFCATASGTTVTLKLTEEGESFLQGIVDEATDDPDIAAALCDPTATSITYADGTFMLGFYYWVAGGTDVTALTMNGAAKQPTAYGDMTLNKPDLGTTTQGFYVIRADFKKPTPQAEWQVEVPIHIIIK